MNAGVLNLVENQGYVFKVKVAIKINIISIYSTGLQHIDVMKLGCYIQLYIFLGFRETILHISLFSFKRYINRNKPNVAI